MISEYSDLVVVQNWFIVKKYKSDDENDQNIYMIEPVVGFAKDENGIYHGMIADPDFFLLEPAIKNSNCQILFYTKKQFDICKFYNLEELIPLIGSYADELRSIKVE